jgi:DNA primase
MKTLYPPKLLDQLIKATNLGDLIRDTERGKANWFDCPFCRTKIALNVSDKHQVYHCFRCGEGGSAVRWVMTRHNKTFLGAIEFLETLHNSKTPHPAAKLSAA